MKNLIFLLLFLLPLLAFASPVEVNGSCIQDDAYAIEVWEEKLPVVDLTGQNISYTINAWMPSTLGGTLTVPYTVKVGTGVNKNYSVIFPSCDVGATGKVEFLGKYSLQDILFVFAVLALWAFGFQAGMHR